MQTVTEHGLRPASESERRWHITPIYGANALYGQALETMWAKRTPEEAVEVLRQPDVMVTNASDKQIQLKKLTQLDRRMRGGAGGGAA